MSDYIGGSVYIPNGSGRGTDRLCERVCAGVRRAAFRPSSPRVAEARMWSFVD